MPASLETWLFDGCRLHLWDEGRGPRVLLTHGAGVDSALLAPQARHLVARGFRVVTWDLRGHGASRPSPVPFSAEQALRDMGALLDHLRIDDVILVGHSLGGNLSQAFARRSPQRVRGLVVIGAAWNAGPLSRRERVLLELAPAVLSLVPSSKLAGLLARASAVTAAARAETARALRQLTKRELLEVLRGTIELLEPDAAYRTPMPLCLIRGAQDATGNIQKAMPAWAAREGIAEVVIDGAGHVATLDAPEAVNRALDRFFDQHGLGARGSAGPGEQPREGGGGRSDAERHRPTPPATKG